MMMPKRQHTLYSHWRFPGASLRPAVLVTISAYPYRCAFFYIYNVSNFKSKHIAPALISAFIRSFAGRCCCWCLRTAICTTAQKRQTACMCAYIYTSFYYLTTISVMQNEYALFLCTHLISVCLVCVPLLFSFIELSSFCSLILCCFSFFCNN